ncbi:MAG: hypothetical protein H7259_09965, partial [Cytophagales bacterium]|nr:hypothetical protein [Cytophaga sp.]
MNNPLLTYNQQTQASVDKDACYVTIQALKERFRSILHIEDCNCVLISVIQKESSKETTIMVECEKMKKMK